MAASTVARVAQMARVLVALVAVSLPAVAADQAVIQPQPELPPYFNNYGMVMKLNPIEMGVIANSYPIVPLTTQMGLNTTNFTMLNVSRINGWERIVNHPHRHRVPARYAINPPRPAHPC
jgi:hypothetical protein